MMSVHEDCILFLLAKAYQKTNANFKKRMEGYGVTPIQYLVLTVIMHNQGLSASEIGKILVLDNATLSGILDRLADNGWIYKDTDDEDKRNLRISLTPKATKQMDALMNEQKTANEEILSPLNVEERLLLKRVLRDLQG